MTFYIAFRKANVARAQDAVQRLPLPDCAAGVGFHCILLGKMPHLPIGQLKLQLAMRQMRQELQDAVRVR
ncbi:hypothetical protein C660_11271 [Alcaligenes sp. HPC1271]|nr:hypothetical protein C660_11271 [Alcaligenes sp. HPC1271]